MTQGSAWHIVGTRPILLFPPPHSAPLPHLLPGGEESRRVNGPRGWYREVGTPSIPEPPPPPDSSCPPICCPRCIPIRRISQPGGSGYRRLNDKVPPLPARPASRAAGTRSGFSTIAAAQEAARTAAVRSASPQTAAPRGGGESRRAARGHPPRPQDLCARLPSFPASSLPGCGGDTLPSPVPSPRPRRTSPTSPVKKHRDPAALVSKRASSLSQISGEATGTDSSRGGQASRTGPAPGRRSPPTPAPTFHRPPDSGDGVEPPPRRNAALAPRWDVGLPPAPLRGVRSTPQGIRCRTAWLALWFNLLVRSWPSRLNFQSLSLPSCKMGAWGATLR